MVAVGAVGRIGLIGSGDRGSPEGWPTWADLPNGGPIHSWDMLTNEAWFDYKYRGALANTPGWSATPATHSAGGVLYASAASGALQSFASGTLRRTDKGVLIEGARTNLCLQSQTFDNASWSKVRSSISADAVVAPDGTTTADKLVEDSTASNTHRAQQSITVSSATAYTFSVFLKAAERTWACLTFFDGTTTWSLYVNLGSGVLGTAAGSPTATSISALANGWYRVSMTITTGNTAGQVQVYTATADNVQSYTGDGASGIYTWGAQLEAASFPSSYIPTTTASATRAADVLTVPVSGIGYPLSLFVEFERVVDTAVQETYFHVGESLSTGTDVAQINISAADLIQASVVTGNVGQGTCSPAGTISAGSVAKAAMRCATNSLQAAKGGALGTEDTLVTVPGTPAFIIFGSRQSSASPCFGYLRRCALWTRALSNSELQTVTT